MKVVPKVLALFVLLSLAYSQFTASAVFGASTATVDITEWQRKWVTPLNAGKDAQEMNNLDGWSWVHSNNPAIEKPKWASYAWIKIVLPQLDSDRLGIYIGNLYAQNQTVYKDGEIIHESHRRFIYDLNKILLVLNRGDSGKTIYIKADNSIERLGIEKGIQIGQYDSLLAKYISRDVGSVVIGFAFVFIAIIMLICSMFLKRKQMPSWVSLSIIILTTGILLITYSPYVYTFYGEYGEWFAAFFDGSLYTLLVAMVIFFEHIFGPGYRSVISKYRKFQFLYSAFCLAFMFVNQLSAYRLNKAYFFATVTVFGYCMLIEFILLIGFAVLYAKRGNKDAILFSTGFAFFTLSGIADLVFFYIKSQSYEFFLWKWGVVGLVIALIIILGRRFASYHDLILNYSKELEIYNNQLQRSEKMEIISELAASVAHEVRNPLQVTRGFLQILGKQHEKGKDYIALAIEELDRAANIITDFLTFAKPQLEDIKVLNISTELKQIEAFIVPLANLKGGDILLDISQKLFVQGNSSKFKQAFINIIKNSIEAFEEKGQIMIRAYEDSGEVCIHVKDNGEGMGPKELAKLGEPYFSTKTKGTGLGLMVTFRIIEVMQGKIEYKSEKGKGTEVIIRFPATVEQASG